MFHKNGKIIPSKIDYQSSFSFVQVSAQFSVDIQTDLGTYWDRGIYKKYLSQDWALIWAGGLTEPLALHCSFTVLKSKVNKVIQQITRNRTLDSLQQTLL